MSGSSGKNRQRCVKGVSLHGRHHAPQILCLRPCMEQGTGISESDSFEPSPGSGQARREVQ
jgi:hypothetical protein